MGAQESTEEAPEGALEEGQSPGAANESKEELTTPTRFRRRSRSEPPDPRAAEALSPAAIDLRLDERPHRPSDAERDTRCLCLPRVGRRRTRERNDQHGP